MSASRYVAESSGFVIDEAGSHTKSTEDENYNDVVTIKKEDISDDEDNRLFIDSSDETEYFEFMDSYESEKDINTKTHINPNSVNIFVSSSTKTDGKNLEFDSSTSSLKLNIVDNKDEDKQKKSKYSSAALVSKSHCEKNEDTSLIVPNMQQFKCGECDETFDFKSHLILHELCHEKGNSDLSQDVVIVKEEILSDYEEIPNADDVIMPDERCEFLEASSFSENGSCLELNTEKSVLNSVGQPLKNEDNSNLVAVFVNSRLKTYHEIYKDIRSSEKNDPKHVKVQLMDTESNTDMMAFNNDPHKGSAYQKHRITTRICKNMSPRPEHNFKCEECDESFELKSHLVMHEISHERYRKYVQYQVNFARKKIDKKNTRKAIYKCKKCTLTFKFKNHLELHELGHMKCRCHCKKPGSKNTELCICFVRLCVSCGRNFFASIKLKNWTKCMKCCLHVDSVMKLRTAFPIETHSELKDEPSRKVRKIEGTNSFTSTLTDVKRLCYSCGKMCANVIKFNASWLCYNCWNVRLQQRCIANLLGGKNKKRAPRGNEGVDCAYCLLLYPERSHFSDHKCLHKSVYLKEDDYCDDYKIGQHFLLSSLEDPTHIDELKQEDNLRNSEKSNNEQDEEMVNVAVQISENNDESLTKFVLCDKTGELITLNSLAGTDNVIQKDFQNETFADFGRRGE